MELFNLFGSIFVKDEATKTIDSIDKKASGLSGVLGGLGKVALGASVVVGTALVGIGAKALSSASDVEEMRGKYGVTFAGMADDVDKWSESFSQSVGRSKYEIQESISNLADLQQGLGMTKEESFDLSSKIVELGTDLASFNNVNDSTAIEAISKAMMGEAESAKQLGLLLNVDRVKAFAEAQGLVYEELTDAERAQQVYNLAITQSQNAIGDAERTSDSFANQMKRMQGAIADGSAELGMQLLPTMTNFVTFVTTNIPTITAFLSGLFEKVGVVANGLWVLFETYMLPTLQNLAITINEVIIPAFQSFILWIQTLFEENQDKISELKLLFEDFFTSLNGFITAFVEWAKVFWAEYGEEITAVIKTAFNLMYSIIKTTIQLISDIFKVFSAMFSGDWSALWESIKTLFINLWDNLLDAFGEYFEYIKSLLDLFGTYFTDAWSEIFQGVSDFMSGIWDGIVNNVKSSVNSIIGLVNKAINAINGLNIDVPEWITELTGAKDFSFNIPNIPLLANGGLVSSATHAIIGEGKDQEAILPLNESVFNKLAQGINKQMNNNGSTSVVVQNMTVREEADISKVARELFNLQQRNQRGLGIV